MSSSSTDRYRARIRSVLEFIDAHLDESLTIERLSEIASFSKFHFHRQFTELLGVGVYQYGESVDADGKVTKHRIAWTVSSDGTVRQFWQSTDATGAWVTAFDGKYVRRKDALGSDQKDDPDQ